jgi:hypothetical protein
VIENVKKYIINFYKTNSKDIAMDFDDVVKNTGIPETDVNKALRQLIAKGFLKNVLYADDLPVNFTI